MESTEKDYTRWYGPDEKPIIPEGETNIWVCGLIELNKKRYLLKVCYDPEMSSCTHGWMINIDILMAWCYLPSKEIIDKDELVKRIKSLKGVIVVNDFQEGYNLAIDEVLKVIQDADLYNCGDCSHALVNHITKELINELDKYKHLPNTLFNQDKMRELVNHYNNKDLIENGPYSIVRIIKFNEDGSYQLSVTKR